MVEGDLRPVKVKPRNIKRLMDMGVINRGLRHRVVALPVVVHGTHTHASVTP